jgi:hypothetical protein
LTSTAKDGWDALAATRLDELERIHRDARGSARGRRWGTEQLNRSLFVVLLAQFQNYCRELHDEAVDVHVAAAAPVQASLLRTLLTRDRHLDHKNPRAGALGSDFGRLGLALIPDLKASGAALSDILDGLEVLVDFRNAVAHGNESALVSVVATGQIKATLGSYREHRKALSELVATMDVVVASGLSSGLGVAAPW